MSTTNQSLTIEQLTERFYIVREQRDRLISVVRKILRWCDDECSDSQIVHEAQRIGDKVMAVALGIRYNKPSKIALEITARMWCDQEMKNCIMDPEAAERIALIVDEVRREQADKLAYGDLVASGGIVGAP